MKTIILAMLAVLLLALAACSRHDEPAPEPEPPLPTEAEHPLVGTWAWEGGAAFEYIFRDDGTGTRGYTTYDQFTWTTTADHLYITTHLGQEQWTFSIIGGILTINSRQSPGMEYNYFRQ